MARLSYKEMRSIERIGQGGLSPGHHPIQGEYWGL